MEGPITMDGLKRLAKELDHYHLTDEDFVEIMKAVSGEGKEITMEDFIRFFTQIVRS